MTYALRETATAWTVPSTCGDAFSDTVRTVLIGPGRLHFTPRTTHAKIVHPSVFARPKRLGAVVVERRWLARGFHGTRSRVALSGRIG
jgi:hypothetical protein